MARQAHGFLALLDLDFGQVGFFQQVDQLLDLAQVHGTASLGRCRRGGNKRKDQAGISAVRGAGQRPAHSGSP
jgi:hypothetical protein